MSDQLASPTASQAFVVPGTPLSADPYGPLFVAIRVTIVVVVVLVIVLGGLLIRRRRMKARRAKAALLADAEKGGAVTVNVWNANDQAGVPAAKTATGIQQLATALAGNTSH